MPRYKTIIVNELAFQAIKRAALGTFVKDDVRIHWNDFGMKQYEFPVDDEVFARLVNDLKILNVDNVSSWLVRNINTYLTKKGG